MTETAQLPAWLQALPKYLQLTCVAGELRSGDAFLSAGFCQPKFNCALAPLTGHNYLNELKPTEQLFHDTCRTASAALDHRARGAPVSNAVFSHNSISCGGATISCGCYPSPETLEKEWYGKINYAGQLVLCWIGYVVIGLYLTPSSGVQEKAAVLLMEI